MIFWNGTWTGLTATSGAATELTYRGLTNGRGSKKGMPFAIYLTRRLGGDSLKQIRGAYRLDKYSSVSRAIERMKALIAKDQRPRGKVEKLIPLLNKSQE